MSTVTTFSLSLSFSLFNVKLIVWVRLNFSLFFLYGSLLFLQHVHWLCNYKSLCTQLFYYTCESKIVGRQIEWHGLILFFLVKYLCKKFIWRKNVALGNWANTPNFYPANMCCFFFFVGGVDLWRLGKFRNSVRN